MNIPVYVENARVTFIDANHCPGAAIILFEVFNFHPLSPVNLSSDHPTLSQAHFPCQWPSNPPYYSTTPHPSLLQHMAVNHSQPAQVKKQNTFGDDDIENDEESVPGQQDLHRHRFPDNTSTHFQESSSSTVQELIPDRIILHTGDCRVCPTMLSTLDRFLKGYLVDGFLCAPPHSSVFHLSPLLSLSANPSLAHIPSLYLPI